jgi:hypothetical protein
LEEEEKVTATLRTWMPATTIAILVSIVVSAATVFTVGRQRHAGAAVAGPIPDSMTQQAVMAAIKHYYDVAAEARRSGNVDLIDGVTAGRGSPADIHFREFVAEQAARGRRSLVRENFFSDWRVAVVGSSAYALFSYRLSGQDTDLKTGGPVEPEMLTAWQRLQLTLRLSQGRWLVTDERIAGP